MNITELKKELVSLGAKTSGSKKVLEKRLAIWKEKALDRKLFSSKLTNVGMPKEFPPGNCFKPLSFYQGENIINYGCIEKWFAARNAKKGKEKGRILALKLFIKFTQVAKKENSYFIKARCCAEQKKTTEYLVQMIISAQKPTILQCSCSCPAGAGVSAACKHIGALGFSLEFFCITGKVQEHISCTSEAMVWNKPTGRGVHHMSIFEINKQVKPNVSPNDSFTDNIVNKLINRGIYCSITQCRKVNINTYNEDHNYHLQDVIACSSRLEAVNEDGSVNSIEKEENTFNELAKSIEILQIIFDNADDGILNKFQILMPTNECCRKTFEAITTCDVIATAVNTKNNKNLWHQARQFRITASRCYSLSTYQKSDWDVKALKYFWPKTFTSKSVRYGLDTEDEARTAYTRSTGYIVYETGLIISKQHPWLAVSPDGIVFKDNKPMKLLEIKCPVIGKEKSAIHFLNQCDFLMIENYRVVLKKKHSYYAQVQLGMAVLNLPECDFVIYSRFSKTFLNIIVPFNTLFVEDLLAKLQHCYIQKMLHVICLENLENGK